MKFVWNRPGGLPECPYFHLSMLAFKWFSIRCHQWHADDDHRAYHDHPHWFITLVLRGGYTDVSPALLVMNEPARYDILRRGSIRFRKAEYRHSVQNIIPGTLTLLLTGPSKRRWGFWVNGKLIKRDKYFVTHGHHPCDGGEPVKIKPNGHRRD